MEITSIKEILVLILGLGTVLSGFSVISSINPMHSVIALVLTFANCAALLILQEAEFLAILFVIVYAGAIAILILFVVMMLNIKLVELVDNTTRYVPIGFIIGVVLLLQLWIVVQKDVPANWASQFDFVHTLSEKTNIESIGDVLYTEYYIYFIVSSLVLLVAMVAAIILTLSHEEEVRRQDLFSQIASDHTSVVLTTSPVKG
jgi:NADH-quinone oxidoreductase subunit J